MLLLIGNDTQWFSDSVRSLLELFDCSHSNPADWQRDEGSAKLGGNVILQLCNASKTHMSNETRKNAVKTTTQYRLQNAKHYNGLELENEIEKKNPNYRI